jgi:hypothetical protein
MIKLCKDELIAVVNTKPEFKVPLCQRIDHFLDHADLRVVDLEKTAKHVDAIIRKLRRTFGEGESSPAGECISMSFFGPFGDFAASFSKVHGDSNKIRLAVGTLLNYLILKCSHLFFEFLVSRRNLRKLIRHSSP